MWLYDEIGIIYGIGVLVVPTDYLVHVSAFEHSKFAEGYYVDTGLIDKKLKL